MYTKLMIHVCTFLAGGLQNTDCDDLDNLLNEILHKGVYALGYKG